MDSVGLSGSISALSTTQNVFSVQPALTIFVSLAAAFQGSGSSASGLSLVEWLQLVGTVIALILCALASAAETALTSLSRVKMKSMAEEGKKATQTIEQLLADPNKFLSAIMVANSLAVIVAATLAAGLAIQLSESWGVLISAMLISLVVLIFCEITPKTIAVQNPERWARILMNPLLGAAWLLTPLIWLLSAISSFLMRIFGGQVRQRGPFVTEDELRMLATAGEGDGLIEEEEREMIHSIFKLGDRPVREIMVPRIDMVTLGSKDTLEDAVTLIMQGGQSRIPVYEGAIDNIIGVLYAKDLLRHLRQGNLQARVRDFVRPAYFVPESKKLDDLLHELQHQRIHIAIIVDEYGSVAGLVTIEDLVEEIIGDIQDEYDKEEVFYEQVSDNEYSIDAKISIDDFNELLDIKLNNEEYDTLGGFVYTQLDKVPTIGDEVQYQNLTLTVLSTKGRRITRVRVVRHAETDQPAEESKAASDHQRNSNGAHPHTSHNHPEHTSAGNQHTK
jgi:putative hemolysin